MYRAVNAADEEKEILFPTAVLALNWWRYTRISRSKIQHSGVLSVKMQYFKISSPFLTYTDIYRKDPEPPRMPQYSHIFTYVCLPLNMGLKPPLKRALLLSITLSGFIQNTFRFSGRAADMTPFAKTWEHFTLLPPVLNDNIHPSV